MFIGELKPYQVDDVTRMVERQRMLVAYEMGLGKTCMTIAALEQLKAEGTLTKPTLVIALSSLKYQWQKEINKFSDDYSSVIDGSATTRFVRWERDMGWEQHTGYIIANYETIVADWDIVKNYEWGAIVCDEATAIKSFRSQRSKRVKELSRSVDIKFALTGTPIENGRPEELYSIMQFVDSKVLGRFDLFDQTFIVRNHFGGVQRYRNLPIFHEKMKQVAVRKIQKDPDVSPFLPETIHLEPILIPLDKAGKELYSKISSDLIQELTEAKELLGGSFSLDAHYGQGYQAGSAADKLRGSIMSKITSLRMLCDSPQLLVDSSTKFRNGWKEIDGERISMEGSKGGSAYVAGLEAAGELSKAKRSPKLEAIIDYVVEHIEANEDHKVVMFTCYLGMLPLIQEALLKKKVVSTPYSGLLNAKEKEESKTLFQTSKDVRVLVSSDAGGYGVDLPQANLLVNLDLPWSSGTAVQRNSRIRRASSLWSHVVIQDFLVLDSIEERQHQMLMQKNAVADAVMDGEGINQKGGVDLTVGSLLNFLKGE
ncbi:HepA Superfamily II DNA/RNA helicases, SNF2 family [uncultured Caudovirales phage]|uniref:HepA Superfamily II DNA/RNA helicases, SNF2 family n=1 Tax=uncultured Caudovirales phage TaxID=2100421 RepID=A0A6J5QE98_9CAUD|nr:HepA Superfamily II DNA/RNA helicases, SNF2 family [uncultured Caudovirales phage]CAB4174433.1 HepA Superfamily II DNA/RNA helicases, SNF2 family [uncultured Caudovirales phage]CAB4179445.1 HepA Superfamily II DNA/RNA helicases, SNF2 family [uncultured Caudovirales phage]CAB4189153.1 HepA Superfamily II DNA/RNA helicases, SNF2 family [uncultured Caudovirales phage]CAB4193521.1 HepA Superfamily II DNA/RNA helicases, SNF2 family [uncultured Caudovirales phage]